MGCQRPVMVRGVSAYLRFPHPAVDRLVFVAENDVWLASIDGGRAYRLTADRAPAANPRLSPDGAQVAWVSKREGLPEVYVMPSDGGVATRITYWASETTTVLGWTNDGYVLAASAAGQPFRSQAWAWALPVDGSPGQKLPYGPVRGIAAHADGTVVVGTGYRRDPAHWKRYRGGTRGVLWITQDGREFVPFLDDLDGQLTAPTWVGDRLAFLSDHEQHGNVYSVRGDGSDLRRHTDHDDFYARALTGDGVRLVYQQAGDLWLAESLAADSQPRRIEIDLAGPRTGRTPAPVQAAKHIGTISVDKAGRASAVEVRGTVQWLAHADGPVRALAATPGVRARLPHVLGTDGSVVWVTDADGDDAIEIGDGVTPPRRIASGQLGRVLDLAVAPDSRSVAVATHDGRILTIDVESGVARELDRNEAGDGQGLAYSPDSAWLAWSAPHPGALRNIRLAEVGAGAVHEVTPVRFVDTEPVFTPDGRYLGFLSARTFDPVYDSHFFELGFPLATRPYVVPLAATTPSPFGPEVGGRPIGDRGKEEESADGDQSDKKTDDITAIIVDVERIADRVVSVPVPAGQLSDLRAAKDGLLWLEHPLTGVLGEGRAESAEPPRASLKRWDFQKRRMVGLVGKLDGYAVSGDGSRIVVHDGEALRMVPADHEIQADDTSDDNLKVDLDRIRLTIDPAVEWRQMYDEAGRLMRDHFWIADMSGVDWAAVLDRYRPLLDRVATRDDLSDLLWEVNGELGTSHAYETPAREGDDPMRALGLLGADLARDDQGRWAVSQVLPGETSIRAGRSPLEAAGLDVQPGDLIVAVNGQPVPPATGPAQLLLGYAGKPVELTIARDGVERRIAVTPTGDDTVLRYQAWVNDRRAYVHARTGGRVGYLHIPDMVATGWADFHRDLRTEVGRDALIVDTRDNSGGHVSQLIVEKLSRRVIGVDLPRHGPAETYPSDAPRGPIVSIANEWSGSDGDIVNAAFKALGLGPVIGVRTWGGVVGIDGRYTLVDGTSVTQPRYAFWFEQFGWAVENYGVDPDIEVRMPPQAWATGADPQLDEGIRVVSEALAAHPAVAEPDLASRPSRRPEPLPPRPAQNP